MNSFTQLFLANLRILYRNVGGLFWTIVMPAGLYVALSVLPIPNLGGTNLTYSDYVLPGMIAYTIMSGGIYGLGYWMTDMKARGVIKRFLVTPIKTHELVISLLASRVVIIFVQVILLTLIGVIFFNAQFAGNILSIIILTLLGGVIFLLVGLLISNYATSYESAAPLTAAIGLPFAFLGNIFFPTNTLPPLLQTISKALPVTYLAEGLRNSYLYDFNFAAVGKDILALGVWLTLLLIFTLMVFKLKE
jgi:ABC-2 type transport system permease protein